MSSSLQPLTIMSTMKQTALTAMFALAASPALAAEGGIPQLDQASYPGQLVWLAISFVLLYLIVSTFIAPRVGGVLADRERAISDAIAKAEELKAKAGNTKGDFEATGAEARAKAADTIAKAVAAAAKESTDAQAKLAAELDAKTQASRESIAKAVAKANRDVDDAAQNLAEAMVEKLLSTKLAATKPTKKAS